MNTENRKASIPLMSIDVIFIVLLEMFVSNFLHKIIIREMEVESAVF